MSILDDKSRKGSIDTQIKNLVRELNNHDDLYTTSSCSGRVSLFGEPTVESRSNGKKGGQWVYSSHDPPAQNDILQAVTQFLDNPSNQEQLVFRFEPFILACECRTLDVAKMMVQIGQQVGFRESGIVVGHERYTVTIRSSARLEIPVCCNGNLLVSSSYIDYITQLSRERFQKNEARFADLHRVFREQCLKNGCLLIEPRASLSGQADCSEFYYMRMEWQKRSPENGQDQKLLHRWGHGTCVAQNKIVLFGGYGGSSAHQRLNDWVSFDPFSLKISCLEISGEIPSPRMGHTLVTLDDKIVIIGGRSHPKNPFNEIFMIDTNHWTSKKLELDFKGRFRHSAHAFSNFQIIIFGGCGLKGPLNDVWILDIDAQSVEEIITFGQSPCPRMSHGACIVKNALFVQGGLSDYHTVYNDMFKLDLETRYWTKIEISDFRLPFCFSHTFILIEHNIVSIFGGCSRDQDKRMVLVDLETLKCKSLNTTVEHLDEWVNVRQSPVILKNHLCLIGGGAFCFSFGSIFSSCFSMDITNLTKAFHSPLVRKQDWQQDSTEAQNAILWGVVVSKLSAKGIKDALKQFGWLNQEYKSSVFQDSQQIVFPLKPDIGKMFLGSSMLPFMNVDVLEAVDGCLEAKNTLHELILENRIIVQELDFAFSRQKWSSLPPGFRLKQYLLRQLRENNLDNDESLLNEIPEKWEQLGDLILLPANCLKSSVWFEGAFSSECFWKAVADAFGVNRLARQAPISKSEMRCSQNSLLWGKDGWVQHQENGVYFSFDVTRCMFSSGNVSERIRMSRLACSNETIVDLYAGIGYYTVPILTKTYAHKVPQRKGF